MTADVLVDVRRTPGVFDRNDDLSGANHEQVVFCRDEETGLKAIIADPRHHIGLRHWAAPAFSRIRRKSRR